MVGLGEWSLTTHLTIFQLYRCGRCRRGRDHMAVGFTITYATSTYHH